jgi:Ser/Thr protein kinase RdoA (MazF antagonist)
VPAARAEALVEGPAAAELGQEERAVLRKLTARWQRLAECGPPETVVHGDFHPGNWRSDGGRPVVLDFADAHWGNPVADGLRAVAFLPVPVRATAARAWADARAAHAPGSDQVRALALAEPLAHLLYAVRYQEFLDGIEASERPHHEGDPVTEIRRAVRCAERPSPFLTELLLTPPPVPPPPRRRTPR